jgi:hypothetical protein
MFQEILVINPDRYIVHSFYCSHSRRKKTKTWINYITRVSQHNEILSKESSVHTLNVQRVSNPILRKLWIPIAGTFKGSAWEREMV